ncbi:LPXTG cell wall anchor domain-containing protein [Streptomyces natalensis]|uniref:LPXTG-domain-containing protein cell wall anchor domain protein n=1 Tax=Streptomyces natalensis ATCC 27448 TaxID=1240678 RepID=A0A0D7CKB9_9ACTN|nr:LPXTG cell wall anchor domain-containing protein [Streptomyces natalensis]KIZ16521.1 LPXTG-domain-containing protein cell wall anchor domain protein [Streptomyces natalensis ATCC 27448]
MRPLVSAGTLTAAVAAGLLLAPSASAAAHGDNGTVKIHDAATGAELRKNEPHVCAFYLDAFGFDGGQQVDWHIEAWAPTAEAKGAAVKSGSLTLDGQGHGRTQELSLPDGHYKLFWTFDGEHGRAKHKVFWTDCAAGTQPGGGKPSTTAAPSGPGKATATPTSSAPAGTPTTPAPSASSPAPSSSPPAVHDLAQTGNGAPVGLLSTAAAALVAAGGSLVVRRRKARQQR